MGVLGIWEVANSQKISFFLTASLYGLYGLKHHQNQFANIFTLTFGNRAPPPSPTSQIPKTPIFFSGMNEIK